VGARVLEDGRLKLAVGILEFRMDGLLDTGASVSVIGVEGWERIKGSVATWNKVPSSAIVKVADGRECEILGSVLLEVTFDGIKKVINFFVIVSLPHELLLGIDFWRSFGLRVGLKTNIVVGVPDMGEMGEVSLAKGEGLDLDYSGGLLI